MIQYTLDPPAQKAVELEVTYWGDDSGRIFDILANGTLIATQELKGEKPGEFIEKRYPIPETVEGRAARTRDHQIRRQPVAGRGLYDVRLMHHKDDAQ